MVALEMNSVEDNLEDGVQTLIRKINQRRYIQKRKKVHNSNSVSYLDKINSLYLLSQC